MTESSSPDEAAADQHHPETPQLGLYQLLIPVYTIRAPEIMLHCTGYIITQEELIY